MRGEEPVESDAPATGPSDALSTGDVVVDAALSELSRLDALELGRHPGVVDAVQAALADRLAESD